MSAATEQHAFDRWLRNHLIRRMAERDYSAQQIALWMGWNDTSVGRFLRGESKIFSCHVFDLIFNAPSDIAEPVRAKWYGQDRDLELDLNGDGRVDLGDLRHATLQLIQQAQDVMSPVLLSETVLRSCAAQSVVQAGHEARAAVDLVVAIADRVGLRAGVTR